LIPECLFCFFPHIEKRVLGHKTASVFVVHSMVLHYGIREVFLSADTLPLGRQDVLVDIRQSVHL